MDNWEQSVMPPSWALLPGTVDLGRDQDRPLSQIQNSYESLLDLPLLIAAPAPKAPIY